MMIFYNGDHLQREQNNYVLRPYVERCNEADIQTLIRRRVNASALFIHNLISGRVIAPNLRNKMTLNPGTRCFRNPEFIKTKFYKKDYSYLQPFNVACHIFNLASLRIDPTLPHYDFKRKLINLPDEAFSSWTKLKKSDI